MGARSARAKATAAAKAAVEAAKAAESLKWAETVELRWYPPATYDEACTMGVAHYLDRAHDRRY